MYEILLAAEQNIGPVLQGPGELGDTSPGWTPWTQFNQILSIAIGILTAIAAIWFLFLLITGALSYMQAGGDQGKAEEARKKITTAIIGLIIVVAAIFIADFIGFILGFDLLNPGNFLMEIGSSL